MKFSLLASGSSGNACVIEENNTKILIDCGTSKAYFMQAMDSAQISVDELDAIFLTHGHIDHTARLKTLKQLESYGTFEVEKSGHHIIDTHERVQRKDITITSIPLSHDYPKTVGYIIESEHHKLVYVTDTGYLNERYMPLLENADTYIFESNHDPVMLMKTSRPFHLKQRILSSSGHLSNEESAQALVKLIGPKTKEIVLAHLSQEANDPSLALDTLYEEMKQARIEIADKRIRAARQFEWMSGGER